MQELEKIITKNDEGIEVVNARQLHDYLESKQDFSTWIKSRIEKYGFIENEDYIVLLPYKMEQKNQGSGGYNKIEYALTMDMAKELSMVENNERGRDVRKYFIEREKRSIRPRIELSRIELAQLIIESETQRIEAEKQLCVAKEQITIDAPKVVFANSLEISTDTVLVKELAGYLKQNGIDIGQNRLFDWLRENEYLCKRGETYNLPTQKALDLKLFEVKVSTINNPNGTSFVTKTTKVTTKGLSYFINKFVG